MNKLTRYIGKTIFVAILLVMMLFVGLECIFSLVSEIRHVGNGDYTTWHAIAYILLLIPQHISQMFPMSALIGTLFGLSILASRSELIVMRAAGLSIGDIIIAVLKLAVLLAIGVWLLGEIIAPLTDKFAHTQKALALSSGQALHTQRGVWLRDKECFIHIQSIFAGGHLEGITRYEFDTNMHLQKASFANYADYVKDHWVLYDVRETLISEDKLSRQQFSQITWVSGIDPHILNLVGIKDLSELSLAGLWKTMRYRQENELDAKPYELAFWQKMIHPFAILVMMFLAIPFIFGPLRSVSMGFRMLVGVLIGFAFFTLNQLFGPLALVYHMPPILGACLPPLLFFMIGLLILNKA